MGRKLELLSALAAILWGFWILNPAWDTFPTSLAFRMMARIASEEIWGEAVLLLGLAQLVVILRFGKRTRRVFAFISIFTWVTISTFFFIGNFSSTAGPTYSVIAMIATLAYIELGSD